MSSLLGYTAFADVLFPPEKKMTKGDVAADLQLRQVMRFQVPAQKKLQDISFVVFDLETTGLDGNYDRIIEIGAQKIVGSKVVAEFSSFVSVDEKLSFVVEKLTGITNSMLKGQPQISSVLTDFLDFIKGSVLIAHNANFDMSFLRSECSRLGIEISWSALCTLKMARHFLADLESRSLDAIAAHYGFTFESRHRAIGDVKVTVSFLQKLFSQDDFPVKWKDCSGFEV